MKRLLFKVASVFLPEKMKVWFPAVSKVIILVAGFMAIMGRPEQADQIIKFIVEVVGEDAAFVSLVGAALAASAKISHEIASDVQVARGKPPLGKPIVKSVLGHDIYVEEFGKHYDKTRDYDSSVKEATAKAQQFERAFNDEYKRLTNENGVKSDVAFVRARNLAKSKTQRV
jgi:hypothetical protein